MQTHLPLIGLNPSEGPFDLITGIPVHPLVVHAVVVLLPLSALALIAIVLIPRWRGTFGWLVLAGLFVGAGATFVAKESGEALAARVGLPQEHASWGDRLPLVAMLLLIVAAIWFWRGASPDRRGALTTVLGVAAIVLAVAAIALTIVVGHSGAEAVWQGRLPASAATRTGPIGTTGLTAAQVQAHSTPADCWTIVGDGVYDLTTWIRQHPGGSRPIEGMCGVDATAAFDAQHGGRDVPMKVLAGYAVTASP
ncbi:MAG: cytochrome b5-like heme/steroid binding domain-containing protein [Actinobacteria bacterium]|nr:cytochrome b5-like heme/steroid binding domain-containing protein [Actinomycetota bacterium]